MQTELGLNMTAMDYRQYDNAIGRFNSMDALSELGMSMTPYQFGNNNPVSFSDPTGLIAGGNPFMNGLWNNSPDNKNTIWTNNGYGSFVNQSYTGMVDIQGGMYTDLTEVVNLPEISVTIRPGGSSIAGDVIRTHVYRNSPFYNYIWEQGRERQLESFQKILEGVGLAPGIGEFADGLNAIIYAARGDKVNAAISTASMVPFLGWAAVSTKYAVKAEAKLLTQFTKSTIDDAVSIVMKDQNKLEHLFPAKHNLGSLVNQLGGQENTVRAVLNSANGKLPANGLFKDVPVIVSGQTVYLRGNVVNGVPRLGTMFIP
ncbi:hypothetical protein FK004_03720 [Flavobacterium kingsejongi]|uniref:RHS repeat-associated core domain-containing protein n=1 Tax=Flavobacterium kingsejongi TaxID=1678728 RepID=A0A2S1LKV5_9FLAO|nr:hypothetical protein FK004_03720 [Flavobacterium kingsejongi]